MGSSELCPITVDNVDPEAAKVIRRLTRFDHQAYLVGGCVRDLLLGRRPKDFDVSTSATPQEIRKLFRNCRIIGRRFRLAHIFFGPKIIETSTFRAPPATDLDDSAGAELLIRRDNTFGTAKEDALRRDFTINGLFYDLTQDRLIDYVGGLPDLGRRCIRTIGDPRIRIQEDPVRILRAVKFAARLDFCIDPATEAAMIEFRGLLARCSPARVLEEIYRLLGTGHAARALELCRSTGVLAVLLPELEPLLPEAPTPLARIPVIPIRSRGSAPPPSEELPRDAEPETLEGNGASPEMLVEEDLRRRALLTEALGEDGEPWVSAGSRLVAQLQALDRWVAESAPDAASPSHALVMANLLTPLCAPSLRADVSVAAATQRVEELVQEVGQRLGVSRRDKERLLEILGVQYRLIFPGRRTRPASLLRRESFSDSLRLLELNCRATGQHQETLARWTRIFEGDLPAGPRRRRRRSRRRHPPRGAAAREQEA